MSLAELAQGLSPAQGHGAPAVHGQLLDSGHLARDVDESSFSVGPALRRLALDTLNHGVVRGLRHAVLDALVREVGETCNFTTLDGAEVLYLDRVEAQWPLRLTLDVGSHVPLHCTASGKLFLALMPAARRVPDHRALSLPHDAQHPGRRRSAARRVRRSPPQGHAFDREEFITGLIAAGGAGARCAGQVRAALAVHAPSARACR
jgi:IclR family transcriptional regulator, acetate operon repressor